MLEMNHASVATFSRKVIPMDINFNQLHVKHNSTIVQRIGYNGGFTGCYWSKCEPIVYANQRKLCHLVSINSPHWLITRRGRLKIPSENSQRPAKYETIIQSTSCNQSSNNDSLVSHGTSTAAGSSCCQSL